MPEGQGPPPPKVDLPTGRVTEKSGFSPEETLDEARGRFEKLRDLPESEKPELIGVLTKIRDEMQALQKVAHETSFNLSDEDAQHLTKLIVLGGPGTYLKEAFDNDTYPKDWAKWMSRIRLNKTTQLARRIAEKRSQQPNKLSSEDITQMSKDPEKKPKATGTFKDSSDEETATQIKSIREKLAKIQEAKREGKEVDIELTPQEHQYQKIAASLGEFTEAEIAQMRDMIRDFGPDIYFTGGEAHNNPLNEFRADYPTIVPPEKLHLTEGIVSNTIEELQHFNIFENSKDGDIVGLVTHAAHVPRVMRMIGREEEKRKEEGKPSLVPEGVKIHVFPLPTAPQGEPFDFEKIQAGSILNDVIQGTGTKEPFPYSM